LGRHIRALRGFLYLIRRVLFDDASLTMRFSDPCGSLIVETFKVVNLFPGDCLPFRSTFFKKCSSDLCVTSAAAANNFSLSASEESKFNSEEDAMTRYQINATAKSLARARRFSFYASLFF